MRAVFFLCLLINAVFFYWQTQGQEQDTAPTGIPRLAFAPGVERLQLVSDGEAARQEPIASLQMAQQAEPADSEPPPLSEEVTPGRLDEPERDEGSLKRVEVKPELRPEPVCFSLGPIAEQSDIKAATSALAVLEVSSQPRVATGQVTRGYWIFLPPYSSYALANDESKKLQSRGIKDLFIMGKGEHQNAISLGLFRSRAAAEDRFEQVRALGYAPEVEEQFRDAEVTWLDIILTTPDRVLENQLADIARQFSGSQLQERACE